MTPWDYLLENLRSLWQEQWIFYELANLSANFHKHQDAVSEEFQNLHDDSTSLSQRARYAKLKSRSPEWWKTQLLASSNESELMFTLLMLLTWGTANTLLAQYDLINSYVEKLSDKNWQKIISALETITTREFGYQRYLFLDVDKLEINLSERILVVLSLRLRSDKRKNLFFRYFSDYKGSNPDILKFCQLTLLRLASDNHDYWNKAIQVITTNYQRGVTLTEDVFYPLLRESNNLLPIDIAKKITDEPKKFPRFLVKIAEAKYKEMVASTIIPVGDIAQKDEWFKQI